MAAIGKLASKPIGRKVSLYVDGVRRRQVAARTLCVWVTNRYSASFTCDAQQIGARKPKVAPELVGASRRLIRRVVPSAGFWHPFDNELGQPATSEWGDPRYKGLLRKMNLPE